MTKTNKCLTYFCIVSSCYCMHTSGNKKNLTVKCCQFLLVFLWGLGLSNTKTQNKASVLAHNLPTSLKKQVLINTFIRHRDENRKAIFLNRSSRRHKKVALNFWALIPSRCCYTAESVISAAMWLEWQEVPCRCHTGTSSAKLTVLQTVWRRMRKKF